MFDSTTWILLLISIVILFAIINVMILINTTNFSFNILWHLIATLFKQPFDLKLFKIYSIRLLMAIWLLVCFILISYYSNIIYSVITRSPDVKIRSVSELISVCEKYHVQLLMYDGFLYKWLIKVTTLFNLLTFEHKHLIKILIIYLNIIEW